jgi:acyl-CoA synthetase (AMP-forming)/AMP-acid ligase II
MHVRDSALMHGYWGHPEKTGGVLVRNPFQTAYDEPAYRTGNLVTVDADGDYVFLGRRGGIMKTRGYRVESRRGRIRTLHASGCPRGCSGACN